MQGARTQDARTRPCAQSALRTPTLDRRTALRWSGVGLFGLLAPAAAGTACSTPFAGIRLRVATGVTDGVYFTLGTALAQAWLDELRLEARPDVLSTKGTVDNLRLLASGAADVVFSQVDVVADQLGRTGTADPTAPRALARIYDDVVHIVVPATSPITTIAALRGARVSLGDPDSGVYFTANRLLTAVGLAPDRDVVAVRLGINEAAAALTAGTIDAFFWSGGLPTQGVARLAETLPIRLLDLEDVLGRVRAVYPEYAAGTVAAQSYGIPAPVTTLLVRNVLLVAAAMTDDLAAALVEALFATQERLARASPAALTIDPRTAIGTQPVPLHPGAERFYRAEP